MRVDDAARAEEQAGLEEGVRDQVEDAGRVGADAHGEEHEAELADGGVREHLLDVVLREADGRGEERGERRRSPATTVERVGRHGEEEVQARDHVDAGGDHGGGVDQRARPASGRPSRRAARRRAGSAPTCRWRRRTAAA